jgi:hypothetical protein
VRTETLEDIMLVEKRDWRGIGQAITWNLARNEAMEIRGYFGKYLQREEWWR